MNNIQVFNNEELGCIRTVIINDQPWFVGKDIAVALGYSNTRDALAKRVDDEDKGVAKCDTLGGTQELAVINESGLYSLILSSKLPSAKKFKRWVTSEVLPAIRKTGHYGNTPLKDVINLIRITRDNMEKQGASPTQIAETINGICEQYGINLPNFVIHPEQVTMKNVFDMVDYVFSQPRGRGHKALTYDDYVAHKASVKMIGGD
jgi:prophage antirepressor-like protein